MVAGGGQRGDSRIVPSVAAARLADSRLQ
jgi:hypothetical protein